MTLVKASIEGSGEPDEGCLPEVVFEKFGYCAYCRSDETDTILPVCLDQLHFALTHLENGDKKVVGGVKKQRTD